MSVAELVVLAQAPARLDPVQARHVDVEEHERRAGAAGDLDRLDPVGRLVQLELGDVLERGRDQLADELVVIDDQHSVHRRIRRCHRISAAIRSKTSSSIELNASTTFGSKCVPLSALIIARA